MENSGYVVVDFFTVHKLRKNFQTLQSYVTQGILKKLSIRRCLKIVGMEKSVENRENVVGKWWEDNLKNDYVAFWKRLLVIFQFFIQFLSVKFLCFFLFKERREKAHQQLTIYITLVQGKTPLVFFPSFSFAEIHPFVALLDDGVVSPSAEGDKGLRAPWWAGTFWKKCLKNF